MAELQIDDIDFDEFRAFLKALGKALLTIAAAIVVAMMTVLAVQAVAALLS